MSKNWRDYGTQQYVRESRPATITLQFTTVATLCVVFFIAGLLFGLTAGS